MKPMNGVLLIEPDKLLAKTYGQALETAGIKSEWQPNAQDAIAALDHSRPALIILELQLTSHNGVEFLHELRSHGDWQDIPVLLHTLVPITDLQLSSAAKQQLGVVGYLYKPHTKLHTLTEEVQQIIDHLS